MDSLQFPLPPEIKRVIVDAIFDCTSDVIELSSDGYFSYYRKVVEDSPAHLIPETHKEIVALLTLFKSPEATRDLIENVLRERLAGQEPEDREEIVKNWVTFAVRLLLMIPTGPLLTVNRSITINGETRLHWQDGTLQDLVAEELVCQPVLEESVKLEKIFNARNLERIAGIEVRWTSNLADHLRMRDDDTAVEIFHYASFLRFHQDRGIHPVEDKASSLDAQTDTILPRALIDETLRTLALLLPKHDRDIERWFTNHQNKLRRRRKLPLDPLARECGQLKVKDRKIENFEYWRDRLVILKQVFDEAEPSSIKQWWCDRRKKVQWYTFWVAALVLGLTIFFGLAGVIEGALQVYLSSGRSF